MRIFENLNFNFLGKRKIAYAVSGIIFLISVISVVTRGFHFGIDFKGGSEIVLQFQDPVDIAVARGYLSNIGLGDVEVKTFGGETGVMIRTDQQIIPSSVYPQVIDAIEREIENVLPGVPREITDSTASSVTYS
ncbi:MAG: hypothetical protein R3250_15045 [Melioribacteraceae bacterium]|nr:hypothetical protein [Melioribacteraceae bacterium]